MLSNQILEKFFIMTNIPVQYYKNNELIFTCKDMPISPDPAFLAMKPYLQNSDPIYYMESPDGFLSACILLNSPGEYIILGPVCPQILTIVVVDRFMSSLGYGTEKRNDYLIYFNSLPKMSESKFCNTIDFLGTVIFSGRSTMSVKVQMVPNEKNSVVSPDKLIDFSMSGNPEIAANLRRLVSFGRINEVQGFVDNVLPSNGRTDSSLIPGSIRNLKNSIIFAAGVICQYAIEGGLDYQTSHLLAHTYIMEVEKTGAYTDIKSMFHTILLDFTRRVRAVQHPNSDSPIVSSVYRDVRLHCYEKLSPSGISKRLSLTGSYLCHHFKEHTGKTLTQYIQEQKIQEAKYLLETTDLSLADISSKLAFSNQQAFQNTFKKIENITPMRYRNECRMDNR